MTTMDIIAASAPHSRSDGSSRPSATVVIVTRNRLPELRIALQSVSTQTGAIETLVVDDGSSDGTSAAVSREWPGVRLVSHEASAGLVVRRNEAARLATGDIIFSLDDDAEFTSPLTVAETLRDFDDDRVGAVAIPYVEPRKQSREYQRAPDADGLWVTDTFIGTAHAVRRSVFTRVGGYRDALVHQGEERDFCIRMLDAGFVVRLGRAHPIVHHESPKRDFRRMDYYGRRNDILFAWQNVPWPLLPAHLAGTTVLAVRSAWQAGRAWAMLRGTLAGYAGIVGGSHPRTPVSRETYRRHRQLKRSPQVLA